MDRDVLYRGLSKAGWAYLFLYLDFNLNLGSSHLGLLPEWAGYVLLHQAIGLLEGEERDLGLLRSLCVLLGGWSGLVWLASIAGVSAPFALAAPPALVVQVLGLYFHFQFFTDLAGLARRYQPPDMALDRRLLRLRTVQVLLNTALFAMTLLPLREGEPAGWLFVGGVLVNAVVGLCLMCGVFALRRCFLPVEEGG